MEVKSSVFGCILHLGHGFGENSKKQIIYRNTAYFLWIGIVCVNSMGESVNHLFLHYSMA